MVKRTKSVRRTLGPRTSREVMACASKILDLMKRPVSTDEMDDGEAENLQPLRGITVRWRTEAGKWALGYEPEGGYSKDLKNGEELVLKRIDNALLIVKRTPR